jgi:hypothetical protein
MVNAGNTALPFEPYRSKIDPKYIDIPTAEELTDADRQKVKQAVSLVGSESYHFKGVKVNDYDFTCQGMFPRLLKTGQIITIKGEVSTPGALVCMIQFRNAYRTCTISVDTDYIGIQKFVDGVEDGEMIAQEADMACERDFLIVIRSAGKTSTHPLNVELIIDGKYVAELPDCISTDYVSGELYFVDDTGTKHVRNIDVRHMCLNFKTPVWVFGDSYLSFGSDRVETAICTFDHLLAAEPGAKSAQMYQEFIRCLSFGTPKYVLWLTGMNDSDAEYIDYANRVIEKCNEIGATPVFARVPDVPSINHTAKRDFIDALGVRSIDWCHAVGADKSNTWFEGMLSGDNVHPTVAGAQVLASRMYYDFPEFFYREVEMY